MKIIGAYYLVRTAYAARHPTAILKQGVGCVPQSGTHQKIKITEHQKNLNFL
jgi:hypothetical protein